MGITKSLLAIGFTSFLGGVITDSASAITLDLTTDGSSGFVNSGFFQQVSTSDPAGSGVIDSFVRLQSPGASTDEKGYNTDFRPLEFDENNSPTFTRSLLLSDVPVVNIGGIDYREFILDINEPNNSTSTIDLNQLQVFLGNAGNLTGFDTFGGNATKIYDLDIGADGDSTVALDDLNAGSGRFDMFAYIPDSLFTGPNQYVYLYSNFSNANGGFEEWAVREGNGGGNGGKVPEPSTALALGLSALGSLTSLRKKKRNYSL